MTEEAIKTEILDLEKRRCEALTSGDVKTLGELMSEDLVHIHGDGRNEGKTDYLYGVENKYKFHCIDRGDLNIRIYDDIVIVIGSLDQEVSVSGIDKINKIKAMTTQTWVKTDIGWKQNTCHMGFLSIS